ncbi:MAG TPA: SurA N-terminal domain-containing protein [Terriglobales bacterium]|nr:SurA N-terminal domain-containing protein [Terriglobales bacterium]
MKRIAQLAGLVLMLGALCFAQGEVLDRVIAVVNDTPIFQSDWEVALRCEAMLNSREPESFTPEEQRDVFNRMVDQELIRQQIRGFLMTPVSDGDVLAKMKEVRSQFPGAESDKRWRAMLEQHGITESEFRARIRNQVEILRFLELRLRPLVRVDFRTVSNYYREQYLPEVRKQGGKEQPLNEVSGKIREILTQQRMDEQVAVWLQTLRESAVIEFSPPAADTQDQQGNESK